MLGFFFLIGQSSSLERLEVSPSCGKSGGSCRITLWLIHAKSAASLLTQTYIPPLPTTAAVAEAASQRAEATEAQREPLPYQPPMEKATARCYCYIGRGCDSVAKLFFFFNSPKQFLKNIFICCCVSEIRFQNQHCHRMAVSVFSVGPLLWL